MSVYYLFDIRKVSDSGKLAAYRGRVLETVTAHGGRYRILGGPAEPVEGDWTIGVPVMIEFPDRASALAWYGSDAYAPLLALRRAAAECAALLIEGCEDPPAALLPAAAADQV